MKNPKVSIIIPIFNVAKYIQQCAECLFEQTYDNCEFIFVDDKSPDSSVEILMNVSKKYDRNFKVIRHETNKGLAASRNTGLKNATGDYILHIDSDDWLRKDAIALLVSKLQETQCDVLIFDCYFVNQESTNYFKPITWTGDKEKSLKKWLNTGLTPNWIYIASKNIYTTNNLTLIEGINICEDFLLSLKVLYCAKKILNLHEPLYFYNRLNVNSYTHNLSKYAGQELKAYEEAIKFLKLKNDFETYKKEIGWRILKCKQDFALDLRYHDYFRETLPFSHKYIVRCPSVYCNWKIKIIMFCVAHKINPAIKLLVKLGKIK